jgi:hypothetical protein
VWNVFQAARLIDRQCRRHPLQLAIIASPLFNHLGRDVVILATISAGVRRDRSPPKSSSAARPAAFRLTSAAAALGPGGKEYAKAGRIADLLEDCRLAVRTAEHRARASVCSDAGWWFICALAGRLLDEGVLLGNECPEIFASVFDRAPVSIADWFR